MPIILNLTDGTTVAIWGSSIVKIESDVVGCTVYTHAGETYNCAGSFSEVFAAWQESLKAEGQ